LFSEIRLTQVSRAADSDYHWWRLTTNSISDATRQLVDDIRCTHSRSHNVDVMAKRREGGA